ncbi:hypothetical protein G7K_3033-t1 [Saitoella complicata NRRL Y-17804]|uniref:Uncharacterized protein n=1 Tax=Saitoella complicata (strain BCRC 22490 / CBS 7301 / JCM 7358 / NBRC 10748 / NRRL Y-17804) TaxID=698492 RepID=A0A0E9NGB4_SAICN|nr:hypothetical protein G7K_3033-t1 [Saitoella complicata NRRL Y-17804]
MCDRPVLVWFISLLNWARAQGKIRLIDCVVISFFLYFSGLSILGFLIIPRSLGRASSIYTALLHRRFHPSI